MIVRLTKERHFPPLRHRQRFLKVLQSAQCLAGLAPYRGALQINLVSAQTIAAINESTLGHQGPTDVLSFDWRDEETNNNCQPEQPDSVDNELETMAEIYLCPEIALENAPDYDNSPSRELVLYAVHGMLHLSGFDDLTKAQQSKMRAAERRVMAKLQEKYNLDEFITAH